MINIIQAEYLKDRIIQLHFSDESWGNYDLQALIDKQSTLVKSLEIDTFFKGFYLETGALCWCNGLALSPGNIHRKLQLQQLLHHKVYL